MLHNSGMVNQVVQHTAVSIHRWMSLPLLRSRRPHHHVPRPECAGLVGPVPSPGSIAIHGPRPCTETAVKLNRTPTLSFIMP